MSPMGQDPEHGEGVGDLHCIDATKTGDVTQDGSNLGLQGYRPLDLHGLHPRRPALRCRIRGQVHCLDAETGKVYWVHDMKAHIWGSTLVADGKVYVGEEDGSFVVLSAGKGKEAHQQDRFRRAGLRVTGRGQRGVYVNTHTHLYAIAKDK